jgi:hypothetical protein
MNLQLAQGHGIQGFSSADNTDNFFVGGVKLGL